MKPPKRGDPVMCINIDGSCEHYTAGKEKKGKKRERDGSEVVA